MTQSEALTKMMALVTSIELDALMIEVRLQALYEHRTELTRLHQQWEKEKANGDAIPAQPLSKGEGTT